MDYAPSPTTYPYYLPPSVRGSALLVTAALPLPPLPPLPPSLYIPPPVDHRDDIPESEQPPRKRLYLSTLGSRYEVGESSTARPTRGQGIDYGFVSTVDAEERRQGDWIFRDVRALLEDAQDRDCYGWWRVGGLMLPERLRVTPNRIGDQGDSSGALDPSPDGRDPLRVIRVMRLEMRDIQAELLALLGQQRRARHSGPKARIPDHQDASGDADRVEGVIGQIRTLGPEAYTMTWDVLKKKMMDKYCPQGEIKKLEIELWNLKFVANETEKVDKYISGLPDNIYGNVKSARPKNLDETIELANDLMDQKLRTYVKRQSDNKRKADDSSKNNHGHQQQPFKRQNVAKVYNMGTGEKKPYEGSLPKCTKCHHYQNGPCTQRCHKCNKIGYFASDCRSTGNTNVANTQKGNRAAPKGNGCFECGAPGHFKRDCPKLKNKDGGNGNAQG
ncbi:putative reverse transcriptase domain-containing protein [Tanacetum coccineum]